MRHLLIPVLLCASPAIARSQPADPGSPPAAHADPGSSAATDARLAPDLRLPPGTRRDAQGQLVSGRGLRDTTDFLAKELDRRGIVVQRVGPTVVRGVELTRFISQTPSTPWLAIHALRSAGKTLIFFVARPKIAATP